MQKKKPVERANITHGEVTTLKPCMFYAECINDENRPAKHVGDWPEKGKIYPIYQVWSKMEGIPLIHVLGFEGEAPYFNAFDPSRFRICTAHTVSYDKWQYFMPIYLN
jgi:hypothetical protein